MLINVDGRLGPLPGASLDTLIDLASTRGGQVDLLGPELECKLLLLARLPANPTVSDLGNLPRVKVDRLLGSEDRERADYLRALADKLHKVSATCDVDEKDADKLRSIAHRLGPGPARHDGMFVAR